VGSGPYLIIPLLGPSSLRDAGGFGVDFTVASSIDLLNINDDANWDDVRIAVGLLSAIDTRKNTSFHCYGTGSPSSTNWFAMLIADYGEFKLKSN